MNSDVFIQHLSVKKAVILARKKGVQISTKAQPAAWVGPNQ